MKFGTFIATTTRSSFSFCYRFSSIHIILPLKLVIRQLNQHSKNFLTTVLGTAVFREPNRYMRYLTCSVLMLSLAIDASLGALARIPVCSVEGLV
jgi:hypothetical protein